MTSKAHQDKRNTFVRSYLLEAIYRGDFIGAELKILFYLLRNTYGFRVKKGGPQRDRVRVSYDEIATATNQHEKTVGRAMRALAKKNVVTVYDTPTRRTGSPGLFGINSDDETWSFGPKQVPKRSESFRPNEVPKKDDLLAHLGSQIGQRGSQIGQRGSQKIAKNVVTKGLAAARLHSKDNTVKITERDVSPEGALETENFALKIFASIAKRYYPMTGPPSSEMVACKKYADLCADDLEHGKDSLNEAFRRVTVWERKNGRKHNKPFDVLNDAAYLFENGIEPEQPVSPLKYYRGEDHDTE